MFFEGLMLALPLSALAGLAVGVFVFAANSTWKIINGESGGELDNSALFDGSHEICALPDIEKDPLAIEINKAYRKHRDRLYVYPDSPDIQKKIDAIEMVLGLPVLRSVNDRDQIYLPAPLIDRGELICDLKKRGPFIDLV